MGVRLSPVENSGFSLGLVEFQVGWVGKFGSPGFAFAIMFFCRVMEFRNFHRFVGSVVRVCGYCGVYVEGFIMHRMDVWGL